MDLTTLVDVAIGMTLVYLGASLFVTIINEYIAQTLQLRGKQLADDLKKLIDDPALQDKLKASPALRPFFEAGGKSKLRSYVDPTVLARLLVGGIGTPQKGMAAMNDVVAAIGNLPDSSLKKQLLALSQSVKADVDAFVQRVSEWADKSLTMMGELYKRRTQIISLGVGFAVAIILNLDTVGLVTHLYRDRDAREATSAAAVELVATTQRDAFTACVNMAVEERHTDARCAPVLGVVDGLKQRGDAFGKLPIGWPPRARAVTASVPLWATMPIGWVLTALAVSLGASFWFDLLNRLVNVRHGMRRPEVGVEGKK